MLAEHHLTVPVVPERVEELIKLNRSCRVTLMRNGDEWFKGNKMIVNKTVNKTFGYFLNEVNQLPVSHQPDLAGGSGMGTRYIYTLDGKLIDSIEQIENGATYVCCYTPFYKKLPNNYLPQSRLWTTLRHDLGNCEPTWYKHDDKFVPTYPKMVILIGATNRPRPMMKDLLTKNTIMKETLEHWKECLKMDMKHITTLDGVQIDGLASIYNSGQSVFVCFGSLKKQKIKDYLLSNAEVDFINHALAIQDDKEKYTATLLEKPDESDDPVLRRKSCSNEEQPVMKKRSNHVGRAPSFHNTASRHKLVSTPDSFSSSYDSKKR